MGLPAHMNVYEWKRGAYRCRILLCCSPVGRQRDRIVGCHDVQHVPVEYSTESSLGGLTKNNTSGKGQWRFQPGQRKPEKWGQEWREWRTFKHEGRTGKQRAADTKKMSSWRAAAGENRWDGIQARRNVPDTYKSDNMTDITRGPMWCRWHCCIRSWYPTAECWCLPQGYWLQPCHAAMGILYGWTGFSPTLPITCHWSFTSFHSANIIILPEVSAYPTTPMWILHCTVSKEGDRAKGSSPIEDALIALANTTQKSWNEVQGGS